MLELTILHLDKVFVLSSGRYASPRSFSDLDLRSPWFGSVVLVIKVYLGSEQNCCKAPGQETLGEPESYLFRHLAAVISPLSTQPPDPRHTLLLLLFSCSIRKLEPTRPGAWPG